MLVFIIVLGCIVGILLITTVVLVVSYVCYQRKKKNTPPRHDSEHKVYYQHDQPGQHRRITTIQEEVEDDEVPISILPKYLVGYRHKQEMRDQSASEGTDPARTDYGGKSAGNLDKVDLSLPPAFGRVRVSPVSRPNIPADHVPSAPAPAFGRVFMESSARHTIHTDGGNVSNDKPVQAQHVRENVTNPSYNHRTLHDNKNYAYSPNVAKEYVLNTQPELDMSSKYRGPPTVIQGAGVNVTNYSGDHRPHGYHNDAYSNEERYNSRSYVSNDQSGAPYQRHDHPTGHTRIGQGRRSTGLPDAPPSTRGQYPLLGHVKETHYEQVYADTGGTLDDNRYDSYPHYDIPRGVKGLEV